MNYYLKDLPKSTLVRYVLKHYNSDFRHNTDYLYKAIEAMQGYRYNSTSGTTFNKSEHISSYSQKEDVPIIEHILDTVEEFTGHIMNNAQRLKQGLKAV